MIHRGFNSAPRRQLIPNLFSNILKVIAEADHPLTHHEIVEAVSERMDRCDEELKRQITVSLQDALIYGYLRVKNFRYSIVQNRLDPNEPRDMKTFNKLTVAVAVAETKPSALKLKQSSRDEQSTSKGAGAQDLHTHPEKADDQAETSESVRHSKPEVVSLARDSIQPSNTQPGTETEEETSATKTDLRPRRLQRKME
ncbi:uncharacterized protein Dwil_GK17533 [Drosophila willistoni]|uniref:DUF4777 domain-containing protein n=1 Tax=Drosophila willistoni TaxID=7260 RepID=B4NP95_DROWI|nr:uncharacterized protein LOC6652950 [Drosophila willistoni]EDW86335.1 uncharacterized protein Dwil_GK17533 [Drosophila willistoni]